jgi:hypothetical protein
VVATISGEGLKAETRSYKTFSGSLTELKEWLLSKGITHVAMESTGVYWKPVYKVLDCNVKLSSVMAASPELLYRVCEGFNAER